MDINTADPIKSKSSGPRKVLRNTENSVDWFMIVLVKDTH